MRRGLRAPITPAWAGGLEAESVPAWPILLNPIFRKTYLSSRPESAFLSCGTPTFRGTGLLNSRLTSAGGAALAGKEIDLESKAEQDEKGSMRPEVGVRDVAIALSVFAALAVAAIATTAAAEKPITVKTGNLVLTFNGGVTPKALLEDDDGADHAQRLGQDRHRRRHPPPGDQTRSLIDTDKNGTIDVRGIPACKAGQLEAQTSAKAEKICKDGAAGHRHHRRRGRIRRTQAPIQIKSKLLAFNGGTSGGHDDPLHPRLPDQTRSPRRWSPR